MKILFLHGLASSGAYKMATILGQLVRDAEVIAPDLPPDPDEALAGIRAICLQQSPDLIVGLSWGGFLALHLNVERPGWRQRILVVNPDLHVSRLMRSMTGYKEYLSPRRGGEAGFHITPELCDRYAQLEKAPLAEGLVVGCFGLQDTLVNCSAEFESLYPGRCFRYEGGHLPNYPELKYRILPIVEEHPDLLGFGTGEGVVLARR